MARILILDDDDELRLLLRTALAGEGHTVVEAGTLGAARRALTHGSVDVAIVEGVLPDGDGIAFVGELRREAVPPACLVLASVWRDAEFAARLGALGVSELLPKPVSPAELAWRVGRLLRAHPERRTENPPGQAAATDELAELRDRYAQTLPEKLSTLESAVAGAHAGGPESAGFAAARALAVRMHGTAGTYGFLELSSIAGAIDSALGSVERGDEPDAQWGRITEAFERAEKALRRPATSLRPAIVHQATARLLVVDRDPEFLHHVEALGRAASFDVLSATDSATAMAIARREAIDMALVDMTVSDDESGAGLARALRGMEGRDDLPIAGISADGSVKNRVAAVHAGASLFLTKPLDTDDLVTSVRRLLDRKESHGFRVLIVDDDPVAANAVARVLRRAGLVTATLADTEKLFDTLGAVRPDLLLLDVIMPVSGFDVCKVIRASPAWQELPIVFLTGATDRETLVACFSVGGDDYARKPILEEELLARVRLRLERAQMFRQRAHEDPLTGLLTRAAFSDIVGQRLAECARRKRPLSISLLDLDLFKQVNDTHGHLAGDRVLRGLGRLLRSRFRSEDVRGRWGGEEFVVGLYEEGVETSAAVLDRLRVEFRQLIFTGDQGEAFSATFSAGIASFPEDGELLDDLMRRADARLYAAKRTGRDRIAVTDDGVAVYSETMR
ncbi:MAG TPA: response regulator [Polyangiaceae bacterium]|jgi:diguanylate cyclase (GGDEF)-like protein|nr:response regulator [Polyangiaceae bacterium]